MSGRPEMIKIGDYETRFGMIAIEKGYISPDELIEALKVQVHEDIEHRSHRLIGEIFLDQGKMIGEEVEEVLEVLAHNI
jgi:hypothetical protein